MSETLDQELDEVLRLDPEHPCYARWKQYHLNDLVRGTALAKFLSARLSLGDAAVLDVGCGLGGISIALASVSRKVVGVEVSEDFAQFARRRASGMGIKNVEFVVSSAEQLDMSAASVDLIIMNDVVEHFADPPAAIAQGARVLKRGGHAFVLAPNRNSLSVTLCDPHYGLPFVVWMPQRWRDAYVRLLGRGSHYDGNWFPSIRGLIHAFRRVGITLVPVGFFEYDRPRVAQMNIVNRILKGYPIYLGTKA